MLTFVAAMVLAIPAGDFAALEADLDETRLAGQGDSSLAISMPEVGSPNESALAEPEDPEEEPEEEPEEDPEDDPEEPDEEPGPEGMDDNPEIVSFAAYVTSGSFLVVMGTVDDEDRVGCSVRISWQGAEFEVGVDSEGSFSWHIGPEGNLHGIIKLTAVDSAGNESATVQDLVTPN